MYFKLIIYIFFSSLLVFPLFSITEEFKADRKGIDNSPLLRYKRGSNYSTLGESMEKVDGESSRLKEKGEKSSGKGSDKSPEKEEAKEKNVKNTKKVLYICEDGLISPFYFHVIILKCIIMRGHTLCQKMISTP